MGIFGFLMLPFFALDFFITVVSEDVASVLQFLIGTDEMIIF